ncbi:unnamed protein product [Fusarium venenatum]|uniref:Uncharacterized protein n=1 Tax=Fusarium venenatum TaxID=56646 RepID=A0A2L2TK95_9HYPO|nr:uncharacterized protein FVRRES_10635 [Fusarium venenatum]CEI70558.1 unnamed protein product [Fusarium venenatum]
MRDKMHCKSTINPVELWGNLFSSLEDLPPNSRFLKAVNTGFVPGRKKLQNVPFYGHVTPNAEKNDKAKRGGEEGTEPRGGKSHP